MASNEETIREIVRRLGRATPRAIVPIGWFDLQRDSDPAAPGAWLQGDIIRVMAPGEPGANVNRGPRKAIINATQLQMPDEDFYRLRVQLTASVSEEREPGVPETPMDVIWNREWFVPLTAQQNSDLDPAGQAFMADMAASLLSEPFLAVRSWSDLNGVAFKSRVTGERLNFV